jgi:4-cresol dehydrogenase (hydroxylating) flavoprotein subunit
MTDNSMGNVTGWSHAVPAVLQPKTVEEIVALVHAARASHTPLYPVSRGLNWGYGSGSPPTAGCTLVDLSGMNRVRNAAAISMANPVAVIEPGVTQGQLYDFLQAHCPGLGFNVTGAGRETSILGCALDRGVGYQGPRAADLFGLEVVTGAGQLLRTGFRRLGEDSPLAYSHPYGLGPILDGLFLQGNFGIVTSACLKLIPRRPREVAVSLALHRESDLPAFIDTLALLKRDGLLTSVTHVANQARTHSTLMCGMTRYLAGTCGLEARRALTEAGQALRLVAPSEWASLGGVSGNHAQVRAALDEIRQRTKRLARMMVVTARRLDWGYRLAHALRPIRVARLQAAAIAAIRPLHGLALGVPTDVAVENLLWQFGRTDLPAADLDRSPCGLLFVNPALPLDGAVTVKVMQGLTQVARDHGHALYATINIETPTSLVAVINLLFDRRQPREVEQAHRCAAALLEYLHGESLEVYRARADMMGVLVGRDPDYWQTVRALKGALDPDNLIAPGRYNIAP